MHLQDATMHGWCGVDWRKVERVMTMARRCERVSAVARVSNQSQVVFGEAAESWLLNMQACGAQGAGAIVVAGAKYVHAMYVAGGEATHGR